ncbi:DUF2339 domain-containing protein [Microbulbifer sp. OS29]|uniref:DUF2339 domain-containing protein n=1 Tax=Microbulbifer okhotskensis TaxID=2926617 RepID=A0A9X2EQT3_9GAMM|nr:DUF2339 domain-containing protein [Microbulbifer okhotskensis]MCO1335675.1 DUF2339 domain-containing protein [Microbulbifer okhotskensis]
MESELRSLRAELALLERDNRRRLALFEQRLSALESQLQHASVEPKESLPKAATELEDALDLYMGTHPEASPASQQAQVQAAAVTATAAQASFTPKSSPAKPHRHSVPSRWIKEELPSLLEPALEPLNRIWEPLMGFYRRCQREGKAPVFFMTAAGILALVFGFAYLLQFSFNAYLGPAGKVTLGFLVAGATTFGGVTFSRRMPHMADYGSGLIALGVILLYLCGYFAGPYYQLVPIPIGVGLLVATTGLSYLLSLLFKTRVVSMVTLLGGASMPLVANHFDPSPVIYLSYLLALALAMLHLSRQIRWPQLAVVTMALSTGMFEFSISNLSEAAPTWGLLLILHGFFYGFAHYILGGLDAQGLNKKRLGIIAANLMLFIHASWLLAPSSTALGMVWLLNLLPWAAIALYSRRLFGYSGSGDSARSVLTIALLHGGLLAGLAILALCSPALLGIVWCLEGLLLIFLGAHFGLISVRSEGYMALFVAGLTMLWQALAWVASGVVAAPLLLSLNADAGWGNWLALCAAAFALTRLLRHCAQQLTAKERQLAILADNAFGLLLSASFLLSVGIFWPQGMWLLALLPMVFLIWRGQRTGSAFCEWLGLSHYLLLFVPMLASAFVVGNLHFYDQIPYGKIASVEAFLGLWLIAELYRRLDFACSPGQKTALWLRKLFYALLPVFFLPTVFYKASDYFTIAVWFSCGIALLLYTRLQMAHLKQELRILIPTASAIAVYGCLLQEFGGWQGKALEGLLLGLASFAGLLWLGHGLRRRAAGRHWRGVIHKALQPLFPLAFYYFAAVLFIMSYALSQGFTLSLLLTQLYFAGLFFTMPKLAPLRNQLTSFYRITLGLFELITLAQVIAVIDNASSAPLIAGYNLIAVGVVSLLVYHKSLATKAVWPKRRLLNLWQLHITTVVVYITLLSQLLNKMWLPAVSFALVVHATLLLFQTLRPDTQKLLRLSLLMYGVAALKIVLWDMQDFSLIQKIVVCMLVGLCMLGAAFQYQRHLSPQKLPG